MNKTCFVALAACAVLGIAVPARAELVFFTSGRSMSVKGHRDEGSSVVLMLRAGGEIVCEPAAIARITPDEVPYPEPEVEAPPKVVNLMEALRKSLDAISATKTSATPAAQPKRSASPSPRAAGARSRTA